MNIKSLFSLSLFLGLGALSAADWPQFRGPNRDDISLETGLLKQWPEGGPQLKWKASGLGLGFATVSVVGNRIYTAGDKDKSGFVVALNQGDGKVLWTAKIGKAGAPGWGSFAGTRSTPTVDGELLFVVGQYGELVCLETATGKELWRKSFETDFGGKRPEWGFSESPLVDGNKVVVTPGGDQGAIVALNKKTGATLWRCTDVTDDAHYSSLIIAEIGGVRQYIQLTPANVVGVAAADGKLLWSASRKGKTAVIPTPIYSDNHVYVTSGYGIGCNLFKITAGGGRFSVQEVYANKDVANHHGGVVKVGDHIYGHSDVKGWVCQEFKTGNIIWTEKTKLSKGSITCADGRLYLRAEDDKRGTVALIEPTPEGFKTCGQFNQPEVSGKKNWPHPVVANGCLYLRDQDNLFCYEVKSK
jgi:outer membrane protein assembly factor BamB